MVALEPSEIMIQQRPAFSAPVVQGFAEAMPFADRAFDVVLAVLTVHHWSDRRVGLRELARVAPRRVVLTLDTQVLETMWLTDYLPEIVELDRPRFPSMAEVTDAIEGVGVITLPLPWDCVDGMTIAYWRRPEAYLDHRTHAGMSAMRQIEGAALHRGLDLLEDDLRSGRWHQRYGHLLELDELDCGLRIVIGDASGW